MRMLLPSLSSSRQLRFKGLLVGGRNANDMSLRQGLTPDALLGRVNGTMRAANRTMGAVGALAGGTAATLLGERPALVIVVCIFAAAFMIAIASPLRTASDDEGTPDS
jgi:hypothetical protein